MTKKLTQIQEELAKAYILNHGNQSEAYRVVYPDSKATLQSLWTLASKAFSNVELQSRIKELQDMATERHLVTIESLTVELEDARAVAEKAEQGAAMTAATMGKAKLNGLITDKKEVKVDIAGDFLKAITPTTGLPSDRDK